MSNRLKNEVLRSFQQIYEDYPDFIVSAPGRINLIGEHTDYSEGFVLPVAINRKITIAFKPRQDSIVNVYAVDFNEHARIDTGNLNAPAQGWRAYIEGLAWALQASGVAVKGWDGVVSGDIPVGAGLSSSAALELATAKVFTQTSHIDLSNVALAKLAREAEMKWVGVNVGIMDQLISAAAKSGCAMKLDCRTLDYENVPIPHNVKIVVLDTMTRRELTHSAYNTRFSEVKQACSLLGITHLRDANLAMVEKVLKINHPVLYVRAKHVIQENQRVLDFSDAMLRGDDCQIGDLLNQSHESLRDQFEVSSAELNLIVEIAQHQPSCLGARMTGAGFGGCALALLKENKVESFFERVRQAYHSHVGITPNICSVKSTHGVRIIKYQT